MSGIFEKTGVIAIGTRLRMLSERVTKESEKIFELYNVDIKPKWYPVVFCLLEDDNPQTVTEIASKIGHSHVSVVKIVKELSLEGYLIESKDKKDARKTNIKLSKKGKDALKGLEYQHEDVTIAMKKMLEKTEHNLWLAIDEFEALLDEESTYPRVVKEQRKREAKKVQIVPYEKKYQEDFRTLNEEWIKEYFKMEEKDVQSLSNSQVNIINKGGVILMALYEEEVVGTCALIKLENGVYELAKMAVSKSAQGKGIGYLLGIATIEEGKKLDAESLFIETNTILTPAISLYKKLGFKQVLEKTSSPYERSNYQMKLLLKE